MRSGFVVPLVVLLALATAAAAPAAAGAPDPDPCPLISRAEIDALQRAPVLSATSSVPDRPAFSVSQCFYTVVPFSKSVSLEVTRREPGTPAAAGPRAQWKRWFHSEAKVVEAGEEEDPPLPVPGVGDEAFWMGNAVTGALYVLQGDVSIRIGIGGDDDVPVKIDKATRLARKALARL